MVNRKNITFACRENGNRHDRNVVDDFFALTKFDCLIRSDSNYSLMASKFADYKIQISPHAITKKGHEVIISEVKFEVIMDREKISELVIKKGSLRCE